MGVIIVMLLMASIAKHDHTQKVEMNQMRQVLCFLLVSLKTYMVLPILDVMLRTAKSCQDDPTAAVNDVILRYAISSMALIFFFALLVYLIRIFTVYMPSELIPWCAPISMIGYLNLCIQSMLVVCNVFDPNGDQILIEMFVIFALLILQSIYRILFKPMFLREVDIFFKVKDFSLCILLFVGIMCKFVSDTLNFDIVYFLALVPFTIYAQFYGETLRRKFILEKIKTKQLKIDQECEYAVYVLMQMVNTSLSDGHFERESFGQLVDLMTSHVEDCEDPACVCDEVENFYDLLQLRLMTTHQSSAPLVGEGYMRFNKIIEDHGLIGTVSPITELTSRNSQLIEGQLQQREEGLLNTDSFQQHAVQQDQESYNKIFQVEINDLKHRFLSEMLFLFCREIIAKFPDSLQLSILSNHFTLHYKQREILCAFQLSGFQKQKLGLMDQWQHIVNQQYLLQKIDTVLSQNANFQKHKKWVGSYDGDYFISMSKLQKNFNESIDQLCFSVVNFWQNFQKLEIDPDQMLIIGGQISKNIQSFFKLFLDIDTLQIIKDHQLFFKFALVQLQILNDPISYDLYIGKMKSILDVNKVYQKTLSQGGSSQDQQNLIIVDSNNSNFGKIIQVNSNFRMLLGYTEQELQSMRIEQLMPQPIMQKHNNFMAKFLSSGENYIMNRNTTMFIKKQNGFVIPVEFFIQFYYSFEYEFTFLAIMRPFQQMAPFKNGIQHSIEQLVFLIVENEREGHVYDFSESFIKMIQSYGMKAHADNGCLIRRITDLMQNINFPSIINSRQDRYKQKEIYEGENVIDLGIFMESGQMDMNTNLHLNQSLITVNTRIFEERYSGGALDLNIICFAFQEEGVRRNKNQGPIQFGRDNNNGKINAGIGMDLINGANNNAGSSVDYRQDELNSEQLPQEVEDHFSNTGSSSSYDGSKMSTNLAEFRSLHSVSDQNTPLTLLIIMRLIALLYLIMMVIASASLAINQSKQNQSMVDVQTMTQAYFKLNWQAMNQRETRVICNIVNGYEPESTSIIPSNRFGVYQANQKQSIDQFKSAQAYLQQSTFQKSEAFIAYEAQTSVPLQFLSDENSNYNSNETISIATNSFIGALTEANSYTYDQYLANISMIKIVPAIGPYTPTAQEQMLYFIFYNGIRGIRDATFDEISLYGNDMIAHSQSSTSMILITEIISIIAILAIGLVVAPMITQIEARRYRALHYFIKIPKDKLAGMIKNCQYCVQLSDENNAIKVMMDYEQVIGIKLNSSQQDKQIKHEKKLQENASKKRKLKVQIQNISSKSDSLVDSSENNNESEYSDINSNIQQLPEVAPAQLKKEINQIVESNSVSQDEDSASKDLEEVKNGKDEEGESIMDIKTAQRMGQLTINQYLKKRRIIMAALVLSILMLLAVYFIISYFLSVKTFNLAQELINPLQAVLYKGSCFDQTMSFLRRDFIRNQTMLISSNTDGILSEYDIASFDSVTYFLSFCQDLQSQYHQFNINLPPYFGEVSQLMQDLEQSEVCDLVYIGQFASLNALCKTGLNGLYQQGMTNTFFYMFRAIQVQNMQFNEIGASYLRNESVLAAMEGDPLLVEIIDFKSTILDPVLAYLKTSCMQSVVDYIQSLLNDFLTAFIVFVVIITAGMIFLFTAGFRNLKRNMLDTNIMLRIIPFEKLEKRDREEVIQFFRN